MPDTSLRDDLSAGFEGTDANPSADVTAGSDATALPAGAETPAPGAGGELTPIEAPSHWPEADRALFGKASREHQQHWLSREQNYSKGYSKVSEELAQHKRDREAYDGIFRDLDRDLGLNGLSRHQFTSQLVQWNQFLNKDPVNALRQMADRFGVDLKTLIEAQPANADPQFSALQKEVQGMKQTLTAKEQERQREVFQSNLSRVEQFATAKGQDGKPLRPYFDEVANDVIRLIRAGERDLDAAYTKALRMNDAVWTKVQAEQAKTKQASEEQERIKRVDAAKRAAAGTSGEGAGTTKPKSLREDLEAGFASWPG